MTEQEERDLRELGNDVSAALQSPWEPGAIVRAFASRGLGLSFTMQVWIDLEAVRSPLLLGELPANREQTEEAFRAFGLDLGEAEEAVLVCDAMQRAIAEAWAAALEMKPAEPQPAAIDEHDGFGRWAPLFAGLVTQCGLGRAEALQTEVGQAFILLATERRNRGWHAAGTPYALRDVDGVELSTEDAR